MSKELSSPFSVLSLSSTASHQLVVVYAQNWMTFDQVAMHLDAKFLPQNWKRLQEAGKEEQKIWVKDELS